MAHGRLPGESQQEDFTERRRNGTQWVGRKRNSISRQKKKKTEAGDETARRASFIFVYCALGFIQTPSRRVFIFSPFFVVVAFGFDRGPCRCRFMLQVFKGAHLKDVHWASIFSLLQVAFHTSPLPAGFLLHSKALSSSELEAGFLREISRRVGAEAKKKRGKEKREGGDSFSELVRWFMNISLPG